MRLTQFTDIGLRALMYLGAHPGRPVPTSEMALRLQVSKNHLMKSLQALSDLHLVAGTRGNGGGFLLVEGAPAIRLGTLVRRLEPNVALVECFSPGSSCPLTTDCRLADALAEASECFFEILDEYTLADLHSDFTPLVHLERRDRASAH
jgi:Rrf2 family nitric oxide-sensitive transcriptional repressor